MKQSRQGSMVSSAVRQPPRLAFAVARRRFIPSACTLAFWLAWTILIGAATLDLAAEDEVVVVRTSGAGPYNQAATRLKEYLVGRGHTVTVLDLDTLVASDRARYKELLLRPTLRAFVAVGSGAAQWLHGQVPEAIGLSYCMVANPEEAGLTQGRKSFGVSTTVAWQDQLALMQETMPELKRIGMLYSRKDADSRAAAAALKTQLAAGLELVAVAVEDYDSVSDAIQDLIGKKPDLIWTSADNAVYSSATVRSLLLLALRSKLPVFGFSAPFVRAGALFGVGVDPAQQGEQCGKLVALWLQAKQAKTEEAFCRRPRVESPQYQIAINRIVAKQLDKRIPDAVTKKADVIYEDQ